MTILRLNPETGLRETSKFHSWNCHCISEVALDKVIFLEFLQKAENKGGERNNQTFPKNTFFLFAMLSTTIPFS